MRGRNTHTGIMLVDPGHAWLSIPTKNLVELNIADEISKFSFMGSRRTYLERDWDAPVYQQAAIRSGWDLRIREKVHNNYHSLRQQAQYCAYWAYNPIAVGSVVSLAGELVQVISQNHNYWFVSTVGGNEAHYRLRKSNPYLQIRPPL